MRNSADLARSGVSRRTLLLAGAAGGEIKVEGAMRTIWPFYVALTIALLLVTYVPALSLTLPALLK
jgi:TRAP-type C4-dicarboxylate transport system permease large subunit